MRECHLKMIVLVWCHTDFTTPCNSIQCNQHRLDYLTCEFAYESRHRDKSLSIPPKNPYHYHDINFFFITQPKV